MTTTSDYLNALVRDKTNLINAIKEKGVEVDDNATFTQLPSKIEEISGGGKYKPSIISFRNATADNLDYELENLDTSLIRDMQFMFGYCSNVTSINTKNIKTVDVTNMEGMFTSCGKITSLDISHFDTSKVKKLNSMFSQCTNLRTLILPPNFCTSECTTLNNTFYNDRLKSLDVSDFDTSNVTDLNSTFKYCSYVPLLDLRTWNFEKVTNINYLFQYCYELEEVKLPENMVFPIITNGVTNIFDGCKKLKKFNSDTFNLPNLNSSFNYTFQNCIALEEVKLPNLSCEATSYTYFFNNCENLKIIDLRSIRNTKITATSQFNYMFKGCTSLEHLDIRSLVLSKYSSTPTSFVLSVPTTCEIIVKDEAEKSWWNSKYSTYTNVKTVEEYEGE